jgi:pimeloyl-ACP methyl ester carboxylesterase
MQIASTPRGRLVARVVLYSTFVFAGIPLALSQVMLKPAPESIGPPPPGFSEVTVVSEGLKLVCWEGAGDAQRPAVVIAHGLGDSIASYVSVASMFRNRGHSAFLVGLRGHGTSEGRYTTLGGREREDVRAAMAHLSGAGLARSGFILSGVSMGAVAVLRAAAGRTDVRGVIAEAPFDNYRSSIAHHARLLYGLPAWVPIIPLSIMAAEWRAGFRADEVDAVAAAHDIHAPLLAIADGVDPRMPEPVVRRVFAAHPGPKVFWVAPGADHAGALFAPGYWQQVTAFLQANGL